MSSPSGDSGSADGKSAAARRAELRRRRVQEKMERRLRVAKGEEAPLRPAAAPAAPGSDSTVKTAPVTRRKHVAPPPPPRQPRATAPSDGGAASTQSTSSTAPPKGADADGKEVPLDAARLAGTLASSPADSLRAKVHRVKFARLLTLMRTLLVALCGAMLGELLAGCASEAGLWHVASNPTEEDPKDWFEEWEAVEDAPADMLDELVRSGDDDFVEEDDLFVDAPGMAGGVEEFPTVNVTGVCRLTVLPIPLVPLALVLARVLGTALEGALQRWKVGAARRRDARPHAHLITVAVCSSQTRRMLRSHPAQGTPTRRGPRQCQRRLPR